VTAAAQVRLVLNVVGFVPPKKAKLDKKRLVDWTQCDNCNFGTMTIASGTCWLMWAQISAVIDALKCM